jgi:hypothetical protein
LDFDAPHHEAALPVSAQVITDSYRKASQNLMEAIRKQWTDANVQEMRDMYGEHWPIGLVLFILISHQNPPPRPNDCFDASSGSSGARCIWTFP